MSSDIYRELILEYYRNPVNKGELSDANVKAKDSNPLCGDVIEMQVRMNGDKIEDIRFRGQGCAISQAAASMLTEVVKGKPVETVKSLGKKDIIELIGIDPGPTRIKCAMLGLKVLKVGVYGYLGQGLTDEVKQM